MRVQINFKVWIEKDGKFIMGKGGYEILKAIDELGSIAKASESLGMSYKFVWSYIRSIERNLGEKVVMTLRGKEGGATLTEAGKMLIKIYECVNDAVELTVKGMVAKELSDDLKFVDMVHEVLSGCI